MRPPRQDIAAPPFPPGLTWTGGKEPKLERLVAAGPLLVHFLDFAQLNSVRTLHYIRSWHESYSPSRLSVVGVHSPRSALTRDPGDVGRALRSLGIDWPVAIDNDLSVFRGYGVKGWPSLFLWSKGGALRWYHLGEGEYLATEEAIREQLADAPGEEWPPLAEPIRPSDAPDAGVVAPTEEVVPGGDLDRPWAGGAGQVLELDFAAAGAYAAATGSGELRARLTGEEERVVPVDGPGLYELFEAERHAEHELELEADPGVEVHSIQFAPGVP